MSQNFPAPRYKIYMGTFAILAIFDAITGLASTLLLDLMQSSGGFPMNRLVAVISLCLFVALRHSLQKDSSGSHSRTSEILWGAIAIPTIILMALFLGAWILFMISVLLHGGFA